MQCEAKSKATGTQCRRRAVRGKRVCTVHGGLTPSGTASPHYKTGRYSRHLPARLAARYQEAQNDATLLELREEIALVDARIADLLLRVDTGESGQVWNDLAEAYADLNKAARQKDTAGIAAATLLLNELIKQGKDDYGAWAEIYEVIEQRRRLVESERKRIVESRTILTVEQAMLMISALTDIIRTHVTDRQILAAITADVDKLITKEDSE